MKANKIKFIGSSFINPNHKAWNNLKSNYDIVFGDYGNCGSEITNTPLDFGICMVHLSMDILDFELKSFNQIRDEYVEMFDLIRKRLTISSSIFLFVYSINDSQNSIKKARGISSSQKLNSWISDEIECIIKSFPNFFILDLFNEFSKIGTQNAFDSRNWYFAHCRFSNNGFVKMSSSIKSVLDRIETPSSKVLVLDCDNTLWGGVIGEDGLDGIQLGQEGLGQFYVDFQKKIKNLQSEGFILTLCSKNNEEEVLEVLEMHEFMILKKEDIVSWRINWKEKSNNISEIAKELNVGVESIVFIDDNPVEREKVKSALPQVNVVALTDDVFEWLRIIDESESLSKLELTDEDINKTKQYLIRSKFESERIDNIEGHIEYLKSIELSPALIKLNISNISRAEQLCLKTNQFNLRTKRHTRSDLLNFTSQNEDFCLLISLKDKYGDHGIIGLVCLEELSPDYIFIESFLLSCRVLGRHLEVWIINEIKNIANKYGYKYIVGEYIPSEKNLPAKNVFRDTAFSKINLDKFNNSISSNIFSPNGEIYELSTNSVNIPLIEIYEKRT
jgi:FkbH-like protein